MARRHGRNGAAGVAVATLGLVVASSWVVLGDTRATGGADGSTHDALSTPGTPVGGAPGGGQRGVPGGARGLPADPVAAPAHGASPRPDRDGQVTPAEVEHAADEERLDGEGLASGMAKLVRDLEFTPGQKEPPQQLVQPQPEPWKRDPSREGPPPAIEAIAPRRARAEGGDRISIRGRNLRVVQVMFGSAPARLLSARGTEVIVETPPGSAGPVTVAVTNDDGTWAVASEPFVYGE